jgi:hypothetical protein
MQRLAYLDNLSISFITMAVNSAMAPRVVGSVIETTDPMSILPFTSDRKASWSSDPGAQVVLELLDGKRRVPKSLYNITEDGRNELEPGTARYLMELALQTIDHHVWPVQAYETVKGIVKQHYPTDSLEVEPLFTNLQACVQKGVNPMWHTVQALRARSFGKYSDQVKQLLAQVDGAWMLDPRGCDFDEDDQPVRRTN